MVDEVGEDTTHLVLGEKKRTLKVLYALAHGIWIVSFDWVLGSIRKGRWLDEKKFQVTRWFPGCQRARAARDQDKPKLLLDGHFVFLNGNTKPAQHELEQLVVICGGRLVDRYKDCTLCISSSSATRPKRTSSNRPIVSEEWFLDSLTLYQRQPFDEYFYD